MVMLEPIGRERCGCPRWHGRGSIDQRAQPLCASIASLFAQTRRRRPIGGVN